MKKIIFDLDNTLMIFDNKYIQTHRIALKNNKFDSDYSSALSLFKSIGRYESLGNQYDKGELLDFVNRDLNKQYTLKLIDDILDIIGNCWVNPVSSQLIDTLEYLSNKYELYVLTNWFADSQAKRLNKVGILKYFKKVVGADMVKPKPSIESFKYVIRDTAPEECIMIGDNLDIDVKGALNAGLKAILYDYKNIYQDLNYDRITKIENLKEML